MAAPNCDINTLVSRKDIISAAEVNAFLRNNRSITVFSEDDNLIMPNSFSPKQSAKSTPDIYNSAKCNGKAIDCFKDDSPQSPSRTLSRAKSFGNDLSSRQTSVNGLVIDHADRLSNNGAKCVSSEKFHYSSHLIKKHSEKNHGLSLNSKPLNSRSRDNSGDLAKTNVQAPFLTAPQFANSVDEDVLLTTISLDDNPSGDADPDIDQSNDTADRNVGPFNCQNRSSALYNMASFSPTKSVDSKNDGDPPTTSTPSLHSSKEDNDVNEYFTSLELFTSMPCVEDGLSSDGEIDTDSSNSPIKPTRNLSGGHVLCSDSDDDFQSALQSQGHNCEKEMSMINPSLMKAINQDIKDIKRTIAENRELPPIRHRNFNNSDVYSKVQHHRSELPHSNTFPFADSTFISPPSSMSNRTSDQDSDLVSSSHDNSLMSNNIEAVTHDIGKLKLATPPPSDAQKRSSNSSSFTFALDKPKNSVNLDFSPLESPTTERNSPVLRNSSVNRKPDEKDNCGAERREKCLTLSSEQMAHMRYIEEQRNLNQRRSMILEDSLPTDTSLTVSPSSPSGSEFGQSAVCNQEPTERRLKPRTNPFSKEGFKRRAVTSRSFYRKPLRLPEDIVGQEYESDEDTDTLLTKQYTRNETVSIPELKEQKAIQPSVFNLGLSTNFLKIRNYLKTKFERKRKGRKVTLPHPDRPNQEINGDLYRANYLGSTQLIMDGNKPSKVTRMMQAQEAVSRIKEPIGDSQPSVAVDLFISPEKLLVLNTTNQEEIMMDHSLNTISYIADIGEVLVLMARRRMSPSSSHTQTASGIGLSVPVDVSSPSSVESGETSHSILRGQKNKQNNKIICHVFESDQAQIIAQTIGKAFQTAYMEFLKANGIDDPNMFKEMDYQEVLNQQEVYAEELQLFANKDMQREIIVPKQRNEPLGVVIVESGWGSMLPTAVLANMNATGPAARCGQLNIGNQIIAINGHSLVGLPLSNCQQHIKSCRSQTSVRLTVVGSTPVVEVLINRPDAKYQLGFSVQNGVICSLLRGGIAERGGIRVGHRIIEINGQSVVAVSHEKIVNLLATATGEIHLRTMPTSIFRLLTGQESPHYI